MYTYTKFNAPPVPPDTFFTAEDQLAGLASLPGFIFGCVEEDRCIVFNKFLSTDVDPDNLPPGMSIVNSIFTRNSARRQY